jgi:hypothetical protein
VQNQQLIRSSQAALLTSAALPSSMACSEISTLSKLLHQRRSQTSAVWQLCFWTGTWHLHQTHTGPNRPETIALIAGCYGNSTTHAGHPVGHLWPWIDRALL